MRERAPTRVPGADRYRKPRLFVATLPYSRRSFRRVVWKSSHWHARLLAAIAAEREACARLAERFDASRLAVAIRSRGELSTQARALNDWAEGHLARYGVPWPGEDMDR